jgi:hypothetical protein
VPKHLRVGGQTYDLGPPIVIDGLFATITYRLEPDGRGTRFPTVMNRLYAGRLSPSEAPAAFQELREIEDRLTTLTPDRAVWSLSDLRRRDDSQLPVNRFARHLGDYFVAGNGRPLLATLQEAVHLSQDRNQSVVLASSETRQQNRGALMRLVLGLVWSVVGYVFFRDWILTTYYSHYDSNGQWHIATDSEGPLLGPLGIFIFAEGLASLIGARYPALADWFNRRGWRNVVVCARVGLFIVYIMVAWQA